KAIIVAVEVRELEEELEQRDRLLGLSMAVFTSTRRMSIWVNYLLHQSYLVELDHPI
ncbi:hypothetical protein Trydic_g18427, partial [Trypoxylus dichotomus]